MFKGECELEKYVYYNFFICRKMYAVRLHRPNPIPGKWVWSRVIAGHNPDQV